MTRQAYDLIAEGFGPGANGPLVVAAELPDAAAERDIDKLAAAIRADDGVAFVNNAGDQRGRYRRAADGDPDHLAAGPDTQDLVNRIRDDIVPQTVGDTDIRAEVGGVTAALEDQSEYMKDRMPLFIAGVVGLSFLLLLVAFRSPLISLKAAIMNLLSVSAAYGVMTLFAKGGTLGQIIGIDHEVPIAPFMPVMMFAILFGLSMDYEVFLVSRIREEYLKHRDNSRAVADGLAKTARVITAAAAIMVVVFLAFLAAPDVFLKLFGIGLASAIFLDATLVRMVLVPAVMQLLGDRNWWIPSWLEKTPAADRRRGPARPGRGPRLGRTLNPTGLGPNRSESPAIAGLSSSVGVIPQGDGRCTPYCLRRPGSACLSQRSRSNSAASRCSCSRSGSPRSAGWRGRVLGIRIGRWRIAVAASIGWLLGAAATAATLGPEDDSAAIVIPLVIFFGVLATLPVAIVLDLVARRAPGRTPRRRWRHPIRAVKAVFAPVGRFRQLVGNARQENLVHVRYRSVAALDSPDLARRLRIVLERSGGMFVKFGQIASTRTDLLPPTITDELSNLHADVERVPPDELEKVLEAELGEPVDQAFDDFESEPLAAASIGETHRAKLHGGHPVVVKVQRPGMEEIVRRDGSVLSLVARTLERRVEAARRIGARELADELMQSIQAELDFQGEASAGIRLRANRDDDVGVAIPAVHRTLTTRRVLVMEEVDGRPLTDAGAVDSGPGRRATSSPAAC